MITKIGIHMKLIEKNKRKNKYHAGLRILEILSKNKYFFIFKNKFYLYKFFYR
jgi:hypothetical protein